MLKNLKPSILFILTVVTLLLVVAMTLAASKPVSQGGEKDVSVSINTIMNGKWPGLGMMLYEFNTSEEFDSDVDTLLANGFTELRVHIPDYQYDLDKSKEAVLRAVAKGANVIWGISSNSNNNPEWTITAENWPTFRQAILDAATWAQANGVYEFQLGNEEEDHVDGTTLTGAQMIVNMKALATEVQEIFTRGNISYSTYWNYYDDWVITGRGDIDLIAYNAYMGGKGVYNDGWKEAITDLIAAFGVDHTYLSEFSVSYVSLDDYSIDETVQAAGVAEMLDYIEVSGLTKAIFFIWDCPSVAWGVKKDDGTYRQLWNVLASSDAL